MRTVSLLVAVSCTLAILAGCAGVERRDAGDGDGVRLGDGSSVELVELENGEGKGSISGVVVDEAIRPVGGVKVDLTDAGLSTETDEAGLFTFADVEPGAHFLAVPETVR